MMSRRHGFAAVVSNKKANSYYFVSPKIFNFECLHRNQACLFSEFDKHKAAIDMLFDF